MLKVFSAENINTFVEKLPLEQQHYGKKKLKDKSKALILDQNRTKKKRRRLQVSGISFFVLSSFLVVALPVAIYCMVKMEKAEKEEEKIKTQLALLGPLNNLNQMFHDDVDKELKKRKLKKKNPQELQKMKDDLRVLAQTTRNNLHEEKVKGKIQPRNRT